MSLTQSQISLTQSPASLSQGSLSFAPPQTQVLPEDRVAELAARLLRTLGVARALAESGRALDLRGIEDGVGQLCAQTLDLASPGARGMVFRLREVLGQVDALSEILARGGPGGFSHRQGC